MRSNGIVVAIATGTVKHEGESIAIRKGEAWDAGSPIVQAHAAMFSADPTRALGGELARDDAPAVVEQSTRNPGQRSNARRARKS